MRVVCIFHMPSVDVSFNYLSTRALCVWLFLCMCIRGTWLYICMFASFLVVCVSDFVFARLVRQVACDFLSVGVCTCL